MSYSDGIIKAPLLYNTNEIWGETLFYYYGVGSGWSSK